MPPGSHAAAPFLAASLLVASMHEASPYGQADVPDASAPVSTEFRAFDGTEEVTRSTRLRVMPAGARNGTAIEMEAPTLDLAPAMYDVQALRTGAGGLVTIKWVERLAVMHYPDEGGRHLEVINFQPGFGALQLRAAQESLDAYSFALFSTGTTTPAGRPVAGDGYVLFVAPAGSYDVRMDRKEHGGNPDTRWLIGVEVPADRTRLKLVDAPGG